MFLKITQILPIQPNRSNDTLIEKVLCTAKQACYISYIFCLLFLFKFNLLHIRLLLGLWLRMLLSELDMDYRAGARLEKQIKV